MALNRLLVTGGAGFIGANFVHYWLRCHGDHRVVVLDALTYAGNRANLDPLDGHPGLRFVHGDIQDEALVERLLRDEGINAIVHFAAESHVDRSILGPDPFLQTNVLGTHALLKVAKKLWIGDGRAAPAQHRFHHVSTDEVYGSLGLTDAGFTEQTPYRPSSPYAASKAASDHLARAYHRTYGLDVTVSNCSNNYGPYQFPEKLVPLVIINVLHGRELPIYGRGINVRDWLHVEDHCRGIELVLERGCSGETYNVGAGAERPNIELVETICGQVDALFAADPDLRRRFPAAPPAVGRHARELVRFVKDRPGHDLRYSLDASKIRSQLGFVPRHSLESGVAETIRWYLESEGWWRGVMDGRYADWMERQYGVPG